MYFCKSEVAGTDITCVKHKATTINKIQKVMGKFLEKYGCLLGILCILFILAPGFLISCIVGLVIPLTGKTVWGVSIIGSIVVAFLIGRMTDDSMDAFLGYMKAVLASTIILILIVLFSSAENIVTKNILLSLPLGGKPMDAPYEQLQDEFKISSEEKIATKIKTEQIDKVTVDDSSNSSKNNTRMSEVADTEEFKVDEAPIDTIG